jgi:hypothetical protein
MASVMAIENQVFGRSVQKINVSVEVGNRDIWLCCGWNYLRFTWTGKTAQDWRWRWALRWAMVPGIGSLLGLVGLD